ncbi:protein FLX-like 2 [Dorcoceras hygrometricum]|uniref:Protein FLX-like 2 n=1 Tax=Dorcoceras hygrometricum TaxID=472368 RepID=A0A2Z7BLJ3_9LAMI|nr:protein FLX-like 2 [Dorcoceras hygrometricum]
MSNQGRVLPPHLRRPLPGPGAVYPDPYSSAIPPPTAGLPPFEMLPPPKIMEDKLSAQHIEIEKLATENQRLAATHGSLRQDLATARHDLQIVHSHISDMKSEKEHQTRGVLDKIAMMEAELESSKHIKLELQQSRVEAQNLVAVRKELFAKVQQLTRDLQIAHSEAQQIPGLMTELDSLRRDYQHYRATYDYEKKLYHDHLESLQVMEKNNAAMSREVEKLRTELSNSVNFDHRTGIVISALLPFQYMCANSGIILLGLTWPIFYSIFWELINYDIVGGSHGGSAGYSGTVSVANYNPAQNVYGATQGQSAFLGGVSGAGATSTAGGAAVNFDPYRAHTGAGYDTQINNTGGYETLRGPVGPAYNAQRGPSEPSYDAQRYSSGPSYDAHRWHSVPGYDAQRGAAGVGYDAQRGLAGPSFGGQTGVGYDMQKVPGNEASTRAATGSQGQAPTNTNATTASSMRGGSENDSVLRSGNPARI